MYPSTLLCVAIVGAVIGCAHGELDTTLYTIEQLRHGIVIRFNTVSQIAALQSVNQDAPNVPETADSLKVGVNPIVQVALAVKDKRGCSAEIGRNYLMLVRNSIGPGATNTVPGLVKAFAIAFAHELVAKCKLNLLSQLKSIENQLKPNEKLLIDQLEESGANFFHNIEAREGTDVVTMAKIVHERVSRSATTSRSKILSKIKPQTKKFLTDFRLQCLLTYNQVYEGYISSIFTLIKLGYDYAAVDRLLLLKTPELNSSPLVKRWLMVAVLCEGLKQTEALSESKETQISPHKLVTESSTIPDELLVDQVKDIQPLMQHIKSHQEQANVWADLVIERLGSESGSKKSLLGLMQTGDTKLWEKMLRFVDAKLNA